MKAREGRVVEQVDEHRSGSALFLGRRLEYTYELAELKSILEAGRARPL